MSTNLTTDIYGFLDNKPAKSNVSSKSAPRVGISYPLGRAASGRVLGTISSLKKINYFAKSTDVELVKGMIRQLFLTRKGERIMDPNYGLKLDTFLFEPLDEALFESLKFTILDTLKIYMPYVNVLLFRIEDAPSFLADGGILIKLSLQIKEDLSIPPFEVKVQVT